MTSPTAGTPGSSAPPPRPQDAVALVAAVDAIHRDAALASAGPAGRTAALAIRWEALTIDARDPAALAAWWAQTLGGEAVDWLPAGVEVRPPEQPSPSLFFLAVPEAKERKNRLHLDLYADDQGATIAELTARGASRADVGQPADAECVVMRDPEGNEFCLLDPR